MPLPRLPVVLLLVLATQAPLSGQDPQAVPDSLSLAAPLSGVLSASDTVDSPGDLARIIPLQVPPGTRLRLSLESGDFDAYLALVDLQEGYFFSLAENDDAAGLAAPTDAQVDYLTDEGVRYGVWVGSWEGEGTGSFTLTARTVPADEAFAVPLPRGEWVEGSLDAGGYRTPAGVRTELYRFQASNLERVMILAEGSAAPELAVLHPSSGGTVARGTWADGRAHLDWMHQGEGSYTLAVTSAEGTEGDFRLRLWMPPMTAAELNGLRVDSLVWHPEYGFSFPFPEQGFYHRRGLPSPHNTYGDGFSRIWYLENQAETVVAILFAGAFGPMTDTWFQGFTGGFLESLGGPGASQVREDGPRDHRGSSVAGGRTIEARCLGTPAEEPVGRALCVAVFAPSPVPLTPILLDGMEIR